MKKTLLKTKLFRKIRAIRNFRNIRNKYQNIITEINSLEDTFKTQSDTELKAINLKLQKEYNENQNLDLLIARSFALTREASVRTIGLKHFDVQLIGGLVLNNQKIAEMRTGEGKTLVATLPACLNALTGKGVHIITVNNYLASRDQVSMGQIYRFLGFDTGLIQTDMSAAARKKNYDADITYVTDSEVAFDYLRDNSVINTNEEVLRPFNYCIIDEVDSVLIDEAQTPLIISDNVEGGVEKYLIACEINDYLKPNVDYKVDEKDRNIVLTEAGSKQIEKILQVQDLYDPRDPWIPYILNAIQASNLYFNNVDYIIQNNRVDIVDQFTGRIMSDRRWGNGLHQAIEAKEKLPIRQDSEAKASITYQNFFLLYPKLSGMTGTAKTSEIEFEKIYNLSVKEIPTARPNLRKDLPDFIYKDQFSKWNAIAQSCNKISSTGQPVLIGTTTVEKSEMLAQLLNEYKLPYQLLNAKPENVRRESEIIAQAGKKSAITIATNMAGRGTDIILGGNINFQIEKELYNILTLSKNYVLFKKRNVFQSSLKTQLNFNSQKFLSVLFSLLTKESFLKLSDVGVLRMLRENDRGLLIDTSDKCSIKFLVDELGIYYKKRQKQENKIVKNLGGLYIIGTERNDSLRVDNQLRGRCGRQGDPGTSRFFLSLDDTLLRLFGGPKVQKFMKSQLLDDSSPLESKLLTKSLDSAQKQVEERAYQQRKNLFDYDITLNKQRKVVYFERRKVLTKGSSKKKFFTAAEQILTDILFELTNELKKEEKLKRKLGKKYELSSETTESVKKRQLFEVLEILFLKDLSSKSIKAVEFLIEQYKDNLPELKTYLFHEFWLTFNTKEKIFNNYGVLNYEDILRIIILINTDKIWREHLEKMTLLREAVRWRGYGQRNPIYEYKKEGYKIFGSRNENLHFLLISTLIGTSVS